MKKAKWAAVLLAVALVVGLVAMVAVSCGDETDEATTESTQQTPRPTGTIELKFSYHTPPQASIVAAYFNPLVKAIEEATGGQVKITQYAGGSLAKEADQYDAVNSGLCDMALVVPVAMPGRFPQMEFDQLPYVFPDAATGAATYWDAMQKYGKDADFKDVVVLAIVAIAPAHYLGNVPMVEVSDFEGKRIRNDGAMEAKVVKALGATPVEIETSELVPSLERGMADGCFLTWSAALSFGVYDVTKYRTECGMFYRVWPIVMNKAKWDSLGTELQNLIMGVCGKDASMKYSADNEALAADARRSVSGLSLRAGNPDITVLTETQLAAWKAKLMPLWDEWALSLDKGSDILADVKAFNEANATAAAAANAAAKAAADSPTTTVAK